MAEKPAWFDGVLHDIKEENKTLVNTIREENKQALQTIGAQVQEIQKELNDLKDKCNDQVFMTLKKKKIESLEKKLG